MQKSSDGSRASSVPGWFAQAIVMMFALYPNAVMNQALPAAWWAHMCHLPKEALLAAFRRAPLTSQQWAPSAQTVREIAEAEAKSLARPQADYSRPCLPEPEPPPPADEYWRAMYERFRRGDVPGSQREKAEACKAIVDALAGGA